MCVVEGLFYFLMNLLMLLHFYLSAWLEKAFFYATTTTTTTKRVRPFPTIPRDSSFALSLACRVVALRCFGVLLQHSDTPSPKIVHDACVVAI